MRRLVDQALARGYAAGRQGIGLAFDPARLAGYFNDLRHKADWKGPTDAQGRPRPVAGGPGYLAPATTVIQFGLAHWDLWLLAGRPGEHVSLRLAIACADWVLENLRADGSLVALPYGAPSYGGGEVQSALTQGQAVSLLVRAHGQAAARGYLDGARRAAALMVSDAALGGTTRHTPDGPVLEELVSPRITAVLNGWVFAIFGLHDLRLAAPADPSCRALGPTVACLASKMPGYDRGYWSNYDLVGNIAKPNYHLLHIAQLQALERVIPGTAAELREVRLRFASYAASRRRWAMAVAVKAGQLAARRLKWRVASRQGSDPPGPAPGQHDQG